MKRNIALGLSALLALALLTSCGGRPPAQPEPELPSSSEAVSQPSPASEEPSQASSSSQPEPEPEPEPELTLEGSPVKQGQVALLRLSNVPADTQVTVNTDLGFTPTFYAYGDGMAALVPARYTLEPGSYHMEIIYGEAAKSYELTIADGEFEVEEAFDIPIGPSVDTTAANAEFSAVTRPLKAMGDAEKYWEGAFSLPLKLDKDSLRVSSEFGYTRIINGAADRHGGVDLPAAADTPVYAPNNGRVLFAGWLELTGYTVCIEHGFGLKSWYYHMNGVTVEADQMVKTGDQIGLVGSTGIFTTGAHLHFAMTVNDVFVNPWQFQESELLS